MPTVAFFGSCLLLIVAPFELLRPLVRTPGQNFSSVEAVMLGALGLWAVSIVATRQRPVLNNPVSWPWAAFVGAALVAAVLAPTDRSNALHMAGRFGLACAVFLLCVNGLTSDARARRLAGVILIVAVISSVLLVLEYLQLPAVLQFLRQFRPSLALVGSQVRAGGPFAYPTIASMFLEVAFALGVGLLLTAVDAARWLRVALLVGALALVTQAVVLTFTRSGLLTIAATLALVGLVRAARRGVDRGVQVVLLLFVIACAEVATSRSLEALQLRFSSESQDTWYRASFDVPSTITLRTGEVAAVPIVVKNEGRLTWSPDGEHPIRLSYHWLEGEGDEVVIWEGERTHLDGPVPPGATQSFNARVRAPGRPGQFALVWDVEQLNRLWFSTEPEAALAVTSAIVAGGIVTVPAGGHGPKTMPHPVTRPGRRVLWTAALALFAQHPLLGIGPDNYRLRYGTAAGLADADPRVHSNNMYLEILAGAGIAGAIALTWLVVSIGSCARRAIDRDEGLAIGAAAAVVAIGMHGMADSFLGFTPTYVLFAAAIAMVVRFSMETGAHAHRV